MRTDVREVLVQHGTAAAQEHPAQVDRGVRSGSRHFWRRLVLLNAAAAVVALVLSLVLGRGAAELVVDPEPAPPPELTGVTVSPDGAQLSPGDTQQLRLIGRYDDDSQKDLTTAATWQSNHREVATVVLGTVRAHKRGSARITARVPGAPASSVVVTVRASKVRLTGIAVIPSSSAVFPEDRVQLAAWGVYSDGTSEDISDEVSWDARDPAVADVDQNGLVTAHAPGRAWIGATRRSQHGHVVLEVGHRSATLTAITVEPAAPGLSVGESVQLQATGAYDDGATRELTEVEWSSDADDVATVDDTGLLTGLAAGSATITATVGDVQQPVEVSVLAAHLLVAIKVTPSAPDLCPPAKAVALQVEATYEDGSTKDVTKQVSWTSRDEKVVMVDATGQATRTGPGSTSITATLAGKADTVKVASCPTTSPSPSTTTPTPPTGTAPGPGFRG